jgi:hypothetical protein
LVPFELADPADELVKIEGPFAADLDDAGDLAGFAHLLDDTLALADQRQSDGHLDPLVLLEELRNVHLCTGS